MRPSRRVPRHSLGADGLAVACVRLIVESGVKAAILDLGGAKDLAGRSYVLSPKNLFLTRSGGLVSNRCGVAQSIFTVNGR